MNCAAALRWLGVSVSDVVAEPVVAGRCVGIAERDGVDDAVVASRSLEELPVADATLEPRLDSLGAPDCDSRAVTAGVAVVVAAALLLKVGLSVADEVERPLLEAADDAVTLALPDDVDGGVALADGAGDAVDDESLVAELAFERVAEAIKVAL